MPSDPLPLSPPVTSAGRRLRKWVHRASMEPLPDDVTLETIIAIEQEARTLARAEVIAEAEEAVRQAVVPPSDRTDYFEGVVDFRAIVLDVLRALSRLGERE